MELLINKEYVLNTAKKILEFNSPTGFCFEIMDYIKDIVESFGYEFETTNKGCGVITVKGKKEDKVVGLSAHVDTLGAMVRSITSEGNLRFTSIGGPILPTLDGEYCKIRTRSGKTYTGTFLSESSAAHVFDDSSTRKRDEKNMVVRIDELVYSKEDVEKLDICSGDFIFIDTKTTIIGLLEAISRQKIVPSYTTKIIISTYEEVGHGASYIPQDITEIIAVDMGCIGDDLGCTEEMVSICAKDSGGPYDFNMTTDLINLAKDNNIGYAVDIYPRYGSDVGAALRGGNNIRGALIGPGVNASHGMERTHYSAIENTMKLLYLYLTK